MNIRQMEIFRAVMRAGTVTAAAQMLNISQPAVSAMLRHCEDQLGKKLFLRIGRRLQPTPEAKLLFPNIDRLFRQIDTEMRAAREVISGTRGTLALAATHSFAPAVTGAVASFIAARGANLRISLQSLPSAEVLERVQSGEADVGLAYGPVHDTGFEAEVFASRSVVCAFAKDHALAAGRQVRLAELGGMRIITYGPHTALGRVIHAAIRKAPGNTGQQLEVNTTHLALSLASAGAGIALVDLQPHAALPDNLVVRPLAPTIRVHCYLVYAQRAARSRLTRDFVQHLLRSRNAVAVPGAAQTRQRGIAR
jgi:DNA-binding transcriptional LysR family regulator